MRRLILLIFIFSFGAAYAYHRYQDTVLDLDGIDRGVYGLDPITMLQAGILNQDMYVIENALRYEPYSINYRGFGGFTALHMAVMRNNLSLITLLLNKGAIINSIDDNGDTPLFLAVKCGSPLNIVEYLVRRGADVNAINNNDLTIADAALEYKRFNVLSYLHSIDKNIARNPIFVTNTVQATNTNYIDTKIDVYVTNIITNTALATNYIERTNTVDIVSPVYTYITNIAFISNIFTNIYHREGDLEIVRDELKEGIVVELEELIDDFKNFQTENSHYNSNVFEDTDLENTIWTQELVDAILEN